MAKFNLKLLNGMPIIVPSQGHRLRMNESSSEQNTHGNMTVASLSSYMDFAEPSSGSCKQGVGKLVEHPASLSAQSLHMIKSPYDKASYCNQLETNTPSSVTISVVHEPESLMEMSDKGFRDDEGDTDFMGKCLIEIVPEKREVSETAGAVDDAIAWAKETLRTGKLENF
ncbi:hypothetical protein EJ110_NYTH13278 [Nymphaea thermarum]|nr:hypothetical protein EJ110_NYTH13278 [Nymphaea thermarum]